MRLFYLLMAFSIQIASSYCCSQSVSKNTPGQNDISVGGSCEGCEAIYESPIAFEHLKAVDTLPDFSEPGPKLVISGTIYTSDAHTPAKDVVLYIYHTDQEGIYPVKGDEKGWDKRHGILRGWIKTGADGQYKFYTLLPASYPNSKNPKHIHPVIKETGKTEYYIDEYLFADDPFINAETERNNNHPRGGNGILKTSSKDNMLHVERDIILGLNIPNYPAK